MADDKGKEKKKRGAYLSVWISHDILDQLDAAAEKVKLNRNKLIQNLIDTGIEEIKIQKKVGLVKLTMIMSTLKDQWLKAVQDAKEGDKKDRRRSQRGVNISVWLDQGLIEDIEDYALKMDMSRSNLIERILEMGLTDLKILSKAGIIPLTMLLRDLKDKWKNRFKKAEKAMEKGKIDLDGEG